MPLAFAGADRAWIIVAAVLRLPSRTETLDAPERVNAA
jgi:hypothetical protein